MLGARDILLPHQIMNPELSSQTEMGITKTDKVKSCSWSRTVIGRGPRAKRVAMRWVGRQNSKGDSETGTCTCDHAPDFCGNPWWGLEVFIWAGG